MTVGSAETDFLTVQVYNGIPDADFTETDALTDGFTVSGQRQCIQVWMFCIPECEVGSRKCDAVSVGNTFSNDAAAGSGQFVRNWDGFTGKGQRDRYISSGIVVL